MDPRFVAISKSLIEHSGKAEASWAREYTAAELDAIADFSWPWEGVQRVIVSHVSAIQVQCAHLVMPTTCRLMRDRTLPMILAAIRAGVCS